MLIERIAECFVEGSQQWTLQGKVQVTSSQKIFVTRISQSFSVGGENLSWLSKNLKLSEHTSC